MSSDDRTLESLIRSSEDLVRDLVRLDKEQGKIVEAAWEKGLRDAAGGKLPPQSAG